MSTHTISMLCMLCPVRLSVDTTPEHANADLEAKAKAEGWITHERVLCRPADICPACVTTLREKLAMTSGPTCPAEEDTNMRAAGKSPDRVEERELCVTGANPRDGASEATGPRKSATGSGSEPGCVVGALADGACEKSASQSDETQTERVYRAVEAWADKMRERGVEHVYETAARYHIALTIMALLAEEREACAAIAIRRAELTDKLGEGVLALPSKFAMASGVARGIAEQIRDRSST